MKTVREIALEAQVEELKKELEEAKKWEFEICRAGSELMAGAMFRNEEMTQRGFDKVTAIVAERVEKKVLENNKKEGV